MNKFFSGVFTVLSVLFVLGLSTNANAQNNQMMPPEIPAEEYKAGNPGWLVSLEEAFDLSKKTGKPIMANFTGSDWCGWCKRLTADVFSKPEFLTWAEKNVIMLEVDFPRMKRLPQNIAAQNESLRNAFEIPGYPTIWVFNLKKDETLNQFSVELLGRTGYSKSVEEFTAGVDQMLKR